MIPTQYVFMVHEDGLLQIKPITQIPTAIKFETEQEAREYIKNYKEQL
jgi:hypothetical protein